MPAILPVVVTISEEEVMSDQSPCRRLHEQLTLCCWRNCVSALFAKSTASALAHTISSGRHAVEAALIKQ